MFDNTGTKLAEFSFQPWYDFSVIPIEYKRYKIHFYWNVSWYYSSLVGKEKRNMSSWISVTSTAFKIVDDFIRSKHYPLMVSFSGLVDKYDKVYSHSKFLDRWKILFGEDYKVMFANQRVWLINKNIDDSLNERIFLYSQTFQTDYTEATKQVKFPKKNMRTGISRNNMIKEQVKRIILKNLYLRENNGISK